MIVFSLLDRLKQDPRDLSDFPSSQGRDQTPRRLKGRDQVVSRAEFEEYRASVRENLEWVLNTRRVLDPPCRLDSLPREGLSEVEKSGYCYGLPDFSQMNLYSAANKADRETLKEVIKRTIQLFEKRIVGVEVSFPDSAGAGPDLRFEISGLLRMSPRPEPVAYSTRLELTRGEFDIEVSADA